MDDHRRIPALDGIRGIAILLVLTGHGLGHTGDDLAFAGVTLFFVLSGYLITGRLLAGQTLPRFYANRARRLLPAMIIMLAVTGPFFVALGTPWWQIAEAGLYVRNITAAHLDAPFTPWAHMWSLATEEQFYLVWPLAFGLLLTRRSRAVAVVGVLSFAAMVAAFVVGDIRLAHFSPVTQAWTLCAGCWLALRAWSPAWPLWLSSSTLRWFGVRSYGMYLWHYPLIIAATLALPDGAGRAVGVLLGIGAAVLSWRYVEQPWLRRRKSPAMRKSPPRPPGRSSLRLPAID